MVSLRRRRITAVVAVAMGVACLAVGPADAIATRQPASDPLGRVSQVWTGVDMVAADDVWAIGVKGDYSPLIKHWDGVKWRLSSAPAGIRNLSGIDHTSSSDVWVGGQGGVLHWNGSGWKLSYAANDLTVINSVVALSPDDVWATGFRMNRAGGITVHWDGTRWTRVGKSHPNEWNFGIGADAPDDVWVTAEDKVMHWNGRRWHSLADAPYFVRAVDVVGPSDVWFAGGTPDREDPPYDDAAIWHWDGQSFTAADLPPDGRWSDLTAIDVVEPDDIWAVGNVTGFKGHNRPLIEHWDGTAWTIVPPPELTHTSRLADVSGLTDDDAWAVGFSREHRFYPSTLTLHWDGTAWSRTDAPAAGTAIPGRQPALENESPDRPLKGR